MWTSETMQGPWATHRRCIYKGAGKLDDDLGRPLIGIANSWAEVSPATLPLQDLAEAVKAGIWQSGGIPFEFGIPHTCGMVALGTENIRYELAMRDLVAGSVEAVSRIQLFDGLVLLGSCDNIIPGLMLGAARVDLPSVVVSAGPMLPGINDGRSVQPGSLTDALFGPFSQGGLPESALADLEERVCLTHGSCPVMGTACSMQIVAEVLGLSIPGSSTVPAPYIARLKHARLAGRAVTDLVRKSWRFSTIVTSAALRNAAVVSMAIGASTNVILHLLSLARELRRPMELSSFDELSRTTPLICGVQPNGPYHLVDLDVAGGVPSLLKTLADRLDLSCRNITGRSLGEIAMETTPVYGGVLATASKPMAEDGGLAILHGNLAPRGAVLRSSSIGVHEPIFRGKARVFDGDSEAAQAVSSGRIRPGEAVVVRFEGPRGAPGMKEIILTSYALAAMDPCHKTVLITDGRFSGFNAGLIIGHVSPEAQIGGPLAAVRDGDVIEINLPERTIDLVLDEREIAARIAAYKPPVRKDISGFLALYARTALQADQGAAMQICSDLIGGIDTPAAVL